MPSVIINFFFYISLLSLNFFFHYYLFIIIKKDLTLSMRPFKVTFNVNRATATAVIAQDFKILNVYPAIQDYISINTNLPAIDFVQ
jgi:hypothetical protein